MLVVQALAGVLFQMQPLDADLKRVFLEIDRNHALAHDWVLVLRDLIALGQVGVEIVLPVEHRAMVDLGFEAKAGSHRLGHAFLVDDGEHSRHSGIDNADMRVWLAAERRRSSRKKLRIGKHLGMHFQAHDEFPCTGCTVNQVFPSYLRHAFKSFRLFVIARRQCRRGDPGAACSALELVALDCFASLAMTVVLIVFDG